MQPTATHSTTMQPTTMQLTYYGANSWLVQAAGLTLLIDPWLVGSLTFGGARWLFEGRHRVAPQPPEQIDLILLSQGLEDHAHRPTLASLDRTIPVVGSPTAAQVVRDLGFQTITALKPGESHQLADQLRITATAGAPVPQIENGYLIQDLLSRQTLYYEPHGFSDPTLGDYVQQHGPVSTVITPIVSLALPLVGPIIKGNDAAVQLAQTLGAEYLLPTASGGEIEYSGFLDKLLKLEGSPSQVQEALRAAGLTTQVLEPTVNVPVAIAASEVNATVV